MIHKLGDAYRNVVSSLTDVSAESRFVEEGKLTPAEFVESGDQLTFKFPTWQWASGEASRRVSYLPADKQFLITRNVPCKTRVRALDYVLEHHTRTEDAGETGEADAWLLPESTSSASAQASTALRDVEDDLEG